MALLVAVENVFPPIPSEVVLSLAGFFASRGDATVLGMIAAATLGSLVGAWVLYGVGAAYGPARTHVLISRYGRWARITESDVSRAERWFDRHASSAVLICRCVPLVRSLISLPAGFRRMPLLPFTLFTTLGSAVWNTIFVVAGYQLGERWETFAHFANYLQYALLGATITGIAYFVWRRWLAPAIRERAAPHDQSSR